jgi:hypothetical protein
MNEFVAKPSIFNMNGSQSFSTIAEAKKFLDEMTGYQMRSADWSMIGKLLLRKSDGSLVPALDIPNDLD